MDDAMIAVQRHRLPSTSAMESDLDLAFRLQIEETLAASLTLQPSSSAPPPTDVVVSDDGYGEGDSLSRLIVIQTFELDRFRQEKHDTTQSRAEQRHLAEELHRHEHGERFTRELLIVPNKDMTMFGDEIQRPMEVDKVILGLSFRLYFKGVMSREPLAIFFNLETLIFQNPSPSRPRSLPVDDVDDLDAMIAAQHHHLRSASVVESDLDPAFRLQIEEALAASLALQPSSSAPPPVDVVVSDDGYGEGDFLSRLIAIQTLELDRFRQEKQDTVQSRAEQMRLAEDLHCREHDKRFMRDLLAIPNKDQAMFEDEI